MKSWYFVVLTVAVAVSIIIALLIRRDGRMRDSATKLNRLCAGVKMAMHDDRRAFLGDDVQERDAAYARFYSSNVLYHGAQSVLYCLDERDVPQMTLRCQLDKDWKCLADLAGQIEAKLP